jgi:hypothetical protein
MPNREFRPIRADVLEEIGPEMGIPGDDDVSPWFDGRAVSMVYDLSNYAEQNGVLVRQPVPVQDAGGLQPQRYAAARLNDVSQGATNQSDTIIDLSSESFDRIRIENAYFNWREQTITGDSYRFDIRIQSSDPGVAVRQLWGYNSSRGGDAPGYLGEAYPTIDFEGFIFGDDGDEDMELILSRGTQGSSLMFFNFQMIYTVIQ